MSSRLQERAHFDAIAAVARTKPLLADNAETFEPAITPAHLPRGTLRGTTGRRVYDLLLEAGIGGKKVLDYACGLGKWGIRLAQLGAEVTGFDLSEMSITRARDRARFNQLDVRFDVADAANLPYEDESFDLVVGIGALHHTAKYEGTRRQLYRVMRPGATAIFAENLAGGPLRALRFLSMEQDAGDLLLTRRFIYDWAQGGDPESAFHSVRVEPMSMLYMAKRLTTNMRLLSRLHAADEWLLARIPLLECMCGECVIVLRRQGASEPVAICGQEVQQRPPQTIEKGIFRVP